MKKILFLLLIFPSLVFAQTNKKISEMDSVTTLTPAMYWPIIDEGEGVPIDRNKRISYSRLRTTLDSRYFQSSGAAALTKVDDTNVTLTLGGTPATALLQATSLTLGWTGQLGVARGGSGAGTLTGILVGNGTSPFTAITDNSTNWNTAFTDRLKWDGGSTGLTASTGRASLGLVIGTDVQAYSSKLASFVSSGISISGTDITATGDLELEPVGQVYIPANLSVVGEGAIGNPTYTDPTPGTSYDLKLGGSGNGLVATGHSRFNSTLIAAGGIDAGESGVYLKELPINIGTWDMDGTNIKNVAHGLGTAFINIRSVSVVIINDAGTIVGDFLTLGDGSVLWDNTNIALQRKDTGTWDSSGYSSTANNRGYVLITYSTTCTHTVCP